MNELNEILPLTEREKAQKMSESVKKAIKSLCERQDNSLELFKAEVELIQKTLGWDKNRILNLNEIEHRTLVKFLQDALRTRNFG